MNQQALQTLNDGLAVLPKGDQSFASDLIAKANKYGKLSPAQWEWVERLADKVEVHGVPDFTKDLTQVGEMSGVIDLFNKAKKNLKYPKIVLQTESGKKVGLSLAGPTSKYHGSVIVTDGGPYGANKFYGTVTPQGLFSHSVTVETSSSNLKDDLTSILSKLSKRPAAVAATYGALTGNCCFCASKLTDPKSTKVGYGPTCAKQWGLSWG